MNFISTRHCCIWAGWCHIRLRMDKNQASKTSSPTRQYLRAKTQFCELLGEVTGKQPLCDVARGKSELGISF